MVIKEAIPPTYHDDFPHCITEFDSLHRLRADSIRRKFPHHHPKEVTLQITAEAAIFVGPSDLPIYDGDNPSEPVFFSSYDGRILGNYNMSNGDVAAPLAKSQWDHMELFEALLNMTNKMNNQYFNKDGKYRWNGAQFVTDFWRALDYAKGATLREIYDLVFELLEFEVVGLTPYTKEAIWRLSPRPEWGIRTVVVRYL